MENHNQQTSPKRNKPKRDPDESNLMIYSRYSGMAFQTGIVIALFTWGGYELDEWLDWDTTFPVFLAIGLLAGLFLGIYLSIKDFIKKK